MSLTEIPSGRYDEIIATAADFISLVERTDDLLDRPVYMIFDNIKLTSELEVELYSLGIASLQSSEGFIVCCKDMLEEVKNAHEAYCEHKKLQREGPTEDWSEDEDY